MWLKLKVRNLQKFVCNAVRMLPFGENNPKNGRVLHLSPFDLDSFLKESATKMKTSPLDRTGSHAKRPGVSSRKKGTDSWSILLQKFPAALMRRSASHFLRRSKHLPSGALSTMAREIFYKIQRALRIIIKENTSSKIFMGEDLPRERVTEHPPKPLESDTVSVGWSWEPAFLISTQVILKELAQELHVEKY